MYILYSGFIKSWICFLFVTDALNPRCWSLGHSLSWVRNWDSCICAICAELKTSQARGGMSCVCWEQALSGGSSKQVTVQQSDWCVHRLLPQIRASYHLLIVHAAHLPVPKYFKLLKKKLCFIHDIFYDFPRHYQQSCSITSAAVWGVFLVIPILCAGLCLTGHLNIKWKGDYNFAIKSSCYIAWNIKMQKILELFPSFWFIDCSLLDMEWVNENWVLFLLLWR